MLRDSPLGVGGTPDKIVMHPRRFRCRALKPGS
jgi:hypothetical protein